MAADKANDVIKKFNNQNGKTLKDFSTKEVILILHEQTRSQIKSEVKTVHKRVEDLDKKLDKHIQWGEDLKPKIDKRLETNTRFISKITSDLTHITDAMPEKGFCEKVNVALTPENDISLVNKVNTMWMYYKASKWILITATGLLIVEGGRFLFSVI